MCDVLPLLSSVKALVPAAEMLNPEVVEPSVLPNTSVPTVTGSSSTTLTRGDAALFRTAAWPRPLGALGVLHGPTLQLPLVVAQVAVPLDRAVNSSTLAAYVNW